MEDRRRSYEHHDHCHKVQKSPTHTVPIKPSKYDEIGDILVAEEIAHKKARHDRYLHAHQTGLAH